MATLPRPLWPSGEVGEVGRPTKIQHSTSHTEVYFPSREQETEKEVAKLETKKGAEYRDNDERGVNGKRGWSGKNIKKILEVLPLSPVS
ncbi:hypothetical protein Y1Q_0015690 [Alligator mississippiensis]|uniref:Uncharacterized protein n=1 Tax=Alligator mississippiensis TaxID=8496 RepID=A0A151NNN0_ALLMI|nr:hypothetical protein Y1Q_0015690 [Alligator mississippiensis]